MAEGDTAPQGDGGTVITVYWRPGCGFCAMLEGRMQRAELNYERRNIWEDPDAAAFVRSVANGNETVPTVTVGDLAMVNPSLRDVLGALESYEGR
jgi:glutaredoxin-like protein